MSQSLETPAQALSLTAEDWACIDQMVLRIVEQLEANIKINYVGKPLNDKACFARNTPRKYFMPVLEKARLCLQASNWRLEYSASYQKGWDYYDLCVFDYDKYLEQKACEEALKACYQSCKSLIKLAISCFIKHIITSIKSKRK